MDNLPIDDHNRFYLMEDRRLRPKEYFKFLAEQAAIQLGRPGARVLDVGCATGEFLYYLWSHYPELQLTGIDVTEEFITKARRTVPSANFMVADIYSGTNLPSEPFDVVFMAGVNVYFSDPVPWIRNITTLTQGSAYIFGVFNPDDLDVRATVQRSGDVTAATPWNLISQKSISLLLDSLDIPHRFTDWETPIIIPRTHSDPIRSWTIQTSNGDLLVINGMQIIHRFAVLQLNAHKSTGSYLPRV